MSSNFFTEYRHIPPGLGFGEWSHTHIVVLIITALACFVTVFFYKKADTRRRSVILKTLTSVCVGSEVLRQIIAAVTGQYTTGNIPLSVCNFSAYFLMVYAFTKSRQILEFAYAIGLPGAIMAMLFPGWANLPIFNFFALYSFFMHGLIICITMALLLSRELVPNPRKLTFTVLFLALSSPIMHFLNLKLGTNFYFLEQPSKGSPLVFIADIFGKGYILGFILLVLIIWFFMYIPFVLIEKKSKEYVK
jgi:hypothetical integral membrane protein (TIGR02206 family)